MEKSGGVPSSPVGASPNGSSPGAWCNFRHALNLANFAAHPNQIATTKSTRLIGLKRMDCTSEKITAPRGQLHLRTYAAALLAAGLIVSVMIGAEPVPPEAVPAVPQTPWAGIFSADQVARGRKAYNSLCARCHGETLGGGEDSPALVDATFFKGWAGKSVGELVEYTRTEMPSDGPGKITRKRCTDIVVYMLSANGFPAGETDLPSDLDLLDQITITRKK